MDRNAYVMFRRHHSYPTKEVKRGIIACGDNVTTYRDHNINSSSVAVTWNCYGSSRRISERVKEVGGKHIVFENGYLSRDKGFFATGMNGINGNESNKAKLTTKDRFKQLGLTINPWNKKGRYILVCAQRGGNYNDMAMHNRWPEDIINNIMSNTEMPVKYRPHPERQVDISIEYTDRYGVEVLDHNEKIEEQIKDAFAVVVYTSNAANEALLQGIPVFYCGPTISCSHLSLQGIKNIETPFYPDNRKQYFSYLSHRQWHIDEIESGEAWQSLTH